MRKFNPFKPKRSAASCKCGCGFDTIDYETLEVLKDVVLHFGVKYINVSSWCRCPSYNRRVGGAKRSQHLYGKAVDFWIEGVAHKDIQDYLLEKYKNKYGIGCYRSFTHFDSRKKKARW